MSHLTSLSLWGKFFKIDLTLQYDHKIGYLIKSSSKIRQPVNPNFYKYFNVDYTSRLILSCTKYHNKLVNMVFPKKIEKILNTLRETCGEDGFNFMLASPDFFSFFEDE